MSNRRDVPSTASTYVLLYAGFVLTGIVNTVLGPLLPWLVARWDLSDAAAGSLFTIQFAGGLAAGAVSGAVAAHVGVGRTMALGHTLMALGMMVVAWGGTAVGAVGIAIAGIGLGCVIPTTNLMAARLSPSRPAAALGAVNLCWGLGAAVWPLMVALFAEHASIRAAVTFVCALLIAMAVAVITVGLPADQLRPTATNAPVPIPIGKLALLGACIALYSGTEAAFGGWITEYTRRLAGGLDGADWAFTASAFWGGLTGGRAGVAVWLSSRLERVALFGGLAVVSASLALILLVSPGPTLVALAAVCGIGLAPIFPVTVAALAREFPLSVAGPMVALGSAGAAVLPWLVGAIADRTASLPAGLAVLLASILILAALQVVRVRM
jgi:FHS family glucose/mannose:H+ symporter-like MFS transporter